VISQQRLYCLGFGPKNAHTHHMAQFLPFRGLRYDQNRVELSKVLCPPYDVIKGDARAKLIDGDEHNIVAIELAAPYGETASDADYQRSATLLSQWKDEGIFQRDDSAYYVYEQEFSHPNNNQTYKRRGVLGALTLEEFGKNVQPHEHTLSGPKADRLNLLRALQTNTSPIFGLVGDDDGWIDGLITDVVLSKPHIDVTDADGITHRLWKVCDDETVNAIEAAFENESVLIADGHHRYETALNYWREHGENSDSSSSVMMMCVSMQDSGLVVLPTHRVVKTEIPADFLETLSAYFKVEPTPDLPVPDANSVSTQIGLILPNGNYLLTLNHDSRYSEALDSSKSPAYNSLDVVVLHRLILEHKLDIDSEKLASGNFVSYTIHAADAKQMVDSGQYSAAFLLNETKVQEVQDVANAGDKMPQKSTYFYPKLITGLVLRPLD
jgi:uncharacterized protein (DUF1015 family)